MLLIAVASLSFYYLPKTGLVISAAPDLGGNLQFNDVNLFENPALPLPLTPKGEPKTVACRNHIHTKANFELGSRGHLQTGEWGRNNIHTKANFELPVLGSPLGVRGKVRGKPDFTADPALADSYKAKVVRDVFNRLKNAKGDFRSRRPYLHFVKESGSGVAAAFPKTGLILLEEKGYDICTSFGKDSLNALAVLLSHELVHCYEKHDWEEYFAFEFQGSDLKTAVNDDMKEDEIQADYLGGFLAYQAGFNTFGIMPKFLDKVYDKYNLTDEKLSNYPKKEERKNIAEQSEEKLKNLLELFEMGNFLVTLEEYDDALEYYYKVLEDFQSREIYNNLGVLSTLSAMKHFTPLQNKYAYPVELDVQSRMRTGSRGDIEVQFREEKLLEAIDFFEKARQLDAFYPIAYLNQGCAHALLGVSQAEFSDLEWEDAESAAQRAIRLSTDSPDWKTTLADAQVLLGILKALKNDTEAADRYFGEALKLDERHFLAKANRRILKGEKPEIIPPKAANQPSETIDGVAFKDIKLDKTHIRGTVKDVDEHKITLAARSYDHSNVLANVSSTGTGGQKVKKNSTFHLTGPEYDKATAKGIKIGKSYQDVIDKYGEPFARMSLGSGAFLHYKLDDGGGIIFQFDGAYKLTRWCIYRQGK